MSADQPARYRRIGEVIAHRLDEDLTWLTGRGDALHGQRGDWLVESPDGGQRTVKDAEFHDLYELVGGDRWRRTGTIMAYQVDASVTIATLEGDATALPGDWVVTAADGSSWPVPDEVFVRSYELLG